MILLFSCQAPLKLNNDVPLNLEALFDRSSSQFPRFQLGGRYSEWQTLDQWLMMSEFQYSSAMKP